MKSFTDTAGRKWLIEIHVAAVKKVRALVDVDLFGLASDGFKPLAELLQDPVKLVDVLYVLCMKHANEQNISDEDFGSSLGGDTLQGASEAFVDELIDFFPDPRIRTGIRKVVELGRNIREEALREMEVRTKEIDLDSEVRKLTGSSGSLPASSESIPDLSPSANLT
jgi:hypothetical protein